MALELQLAHCEKCKGYCSSTVLDRKDLHHPDIIDHYFYHGEPWFTLDKKTFDLSMDQRTSNVRVVDFIEHLENDQHYCTCANGSQLKKDHNLKINTDKKKVKEYVDNDIYFYDLYITYNNFHQDIPSRQAI